jgi:hypothetical protein
MKLADYNKESLMEFYCAWHYKAFKLAPKLDSHQWSKAVLIKQIRSLQYIVKSSEPISIQGRSLE